MKDDLYVAECPEVGTASQGYTVEEAVLNLKEATELYLFVQVRQRGSHVVLKKSTATGEIGVACPFMPSSQSAHSTEFLKQARITPEEFLQNL